MSEIHIRRARSRSLRRAAPVAIAVAIWMAAMFVVGADNQRAFASIYALGTGIAAVALVALWLRGRTAASHASDDWSSALNLPFAFLLAAAATGALLWTRRGVPAPIWWPFLRLAGLLWVVVAMVRQSRHYRQPLPAPDASERSNRDPLTE